MTEVVSYKCTNCNATYGPLGLHGFSMSSGDGELIATCYTCKKLYVARMKGNDMVNPECAICKSELKFFNQACPKCEASLTQILGM